MEGHHLLVSVAADGRDIDANARYEEHEYEMHSNSPTMNNSEVCEKCGLWKLKTRKINANVEPDKGAILVLPLQKS